MNASALNAVPKRVQVYEVGPRDGLQNELRTLATEDKVRLIEALIAAGEKRIEVSSFVSPRWIPQHTPAARQSPMLPALEPPLAADPRCVRA